MGCQFALGVLILSAGVAIVAPKATEASTQFPYIAWIGEENVYVRSGPGQTYYPTDKLAKGTRVEVYRHDPGGWCVVRPPAGSFSWVSGRYVQPREGGMGVITADGVAARIGCAFSDQREVVHIRLHRGQVVRILGQKNFSSGESGLWYQIAPPPGEFRWIHGKYVDPNYQTSGLSQPRSAATADAAGATSGVVGEVAVRTAEHWATAESRATTESRAMTESWGTDGARTGVVAATSIATAPRLLPDSSEEPPAQQGVASLFEPDPADDPVTARVKQLRLDLAVMLAEEPSVWSFDEFVAEAQTLFQRAETAIQRGRVRLLLEAIERSQEVKSRYAAVDQLRDTTDRQNRQLALLARAYSDRDATPPGQERSPYDIVGYLLRNPQASPNDPPYILCDENVVPLCYVSPGPGVNLEFFLRRRVGLNGVMTYLPDRARLLQARQAVPLATAP